MAKKEKWWLLEWLTTIYLALMVSVFLLSFTDYTQITALKDFVFYIVCGGYAALMVLFLAEGVLIGSFSLKAVWNKIKPDSIVQILMLIYLAVTVVSALLSKFPGVWYGGVRNEGAVTISIYVLCFYGLVKFAKPKKWMIYLFGVATALFAILCIIQLLGLNPFKLYPEGYNFFDHDKHYAGAYLGTLGNIDLVASFLCVTIPALLIYILRAKEKQRFWLLIPLALNLFVLLRMWVLAGIVGIFLGTLIFIPFVVGFSKKAHTYYWSGIGILAVAAIAFIYLYDFGSGVLHELHLILHGTIYGSFGSARIHIWQNVLKLVPENFFFGAGPDSLAYSNIPPLEMFVENLNANVKSHIDTAHNEYLNILFHQGVFAVIAYIGALATALYKWLKQSDKNSTAVIFGGAVLCYALQAFFGISQLISAPFLWVSLGLLENAFKNRRIL